MAYGGGGGGVTIIRQEVRGGPGSAARNTSMASRRESIKIGTLPAGQYYYCHPFIIADGTCIYTYVYIYICIYIYSLFIVFFGGEGGVSELIRKQI